MSQNTTSIRKLWSQNNKKMYSEELDYPVHKFESKTGKRNLGIPLPRDKHMTLQQKKSPGTQIEKSRPIGNERNKDSPFLNNNKGRQYTHMLPNSMRIS